VPLLVVLLVQVLDVRIDAGDLRSLTSPKDHASALAILRKAKTGGEKLSGLGDGAVQWEGAPRGSSATYGSSSAFLSTTT